MPAQGAAGTETLRFADPPMQLRMATKRLRSEWHPLSRSLCSRAMDKM